MQSKTEQTLKKRNATLKKELAAKNRELEIEAALERVRTVAIGINKPGDLPGICEVLYTELQRLGFNDLRNAMINIHGDEKSSFINYDYSDEIGKSINHLSYDIHPLIEKQVRQVRSAHGFSHTKFAGKDLDEWKAFRKKIGEKDDPRIENAKALHYYFYSVGTGSIGISTFSAITKEILAVLKRFRNVFDFAYRRYLDVAKAEAQAREAKIELALERVRARTMAMQKSDELPETASVLFQQFKELGQDPIQITIGIINEEAGVVEFSVTDWSGGGLQVNRSFNGSIEEPTLLNKEYKAWKEQKKSIVVDLSGKELNGWVNYRNTLSGVTIHSADTLGRRVVSFAFFSKGHISISTPEPCPPETIRLLERFAAVFEQTYTRFLDLQKAEAQAREAQIEAALERVRSRTMGMQHSNELQETALLLFQQVLALDVSQFGCGFNIWDDDMKAFTSWMGGGLGENTVVPTFKVPTSEDIFLHIREAAERGESLFVREQSGEELEKHYRYMFSLPIWKDVMKGWTPPTYQVLHCAFFTQGFLMFISAEPVPQAHDIFKRFAKVFEQTYTRFLDLQKAEAQAREAKIETALERVRSRTMAMHKSEELAETAAVLFKQLSDLGNEPVRISIGIPDEASGMVDFWVTDQSGEQVKINYRGRLDEPTSISKIFEGLKTGHKSLIIDLQGKEFENWNRYRREEMGVINKSEELKNRRLQNVAYFTQGWLNMSTNEPASKETINLLERFAAVFNLTFTRFLDLQKAEAQARESQIEAALERVRSRSMGMQKSEELKEVIQEVYGQFVHLNIHIDHTGFVVDYKPKDDWHFWIADQQEIPSKITHPYFDSVWANQFDEAKEKGIDFFATNLNFEEKNKFYQVLLNIIPGLPEEAKEFYFSCPGLSGSTVLLDNVSLYIENFDGIPYTDEENNTLMRFGKVFQQTYTRFLDLQKAEAQAKESQIQLALERVRARTMAMQRSEELTDAATLLFKQVIDLGVPAWTSGFQLWNEDRKSVTIWTCTEGVMLPPFKISTKEDPLMIHIVDAAAKGEVLYVEEMGGKALEKHYRFMVTAAPDIFKSIAKAGFTPPTYSVNYAAYFSFGYLLFITHKPCPDAQDIFKRFAKVFEQTYTRFLDLQKAEAQVLEAIKRTSVDRVRAEIASMRTTIDLERIQPLIWNELTTLGVPFIRCGVFIMDEEQQQVQSFLSTPEGKAIAAFRQPYNAPSISAMVDSWHKKEIYQQHWNEAQFIEFTTNLVQQGEVTSGESYLTENRPTDLYLHFLPFLQGMLYAGNAEPLSEDQLQLVQNLADAFSTAYARYEDFNKLETANIKIEKTLTDLKQTQAQLVQSEKMASLGELTAGIAHEIQNPLNFVNNFSEVNAELLTEMKDEIEKGNMDEVKSIANDVIENEEKINHHGKRADAIVKGMLQHSRTSTGKKEPTNINALADEYLRLSYHGLRAKDKEFNATMDTDFDQSIGDIHIIQQDIGRVFLNLYNNAFYAVTEKKKRQSEGYDPTVSVSTKKINDKVEIRVKDNGNGIPQKVVDKIFQPFFTTKPTGVGIGLGLSLSYDIIKVHGGEIKVNTNEGEFTEFVIQLPVSV